MSNKSKQVVGKLITATQVIIFLFWIVSGVNENSFNFTKFNFAPVPGIGDMISFGVMALIIYGLQKVKVKLNVGEDFQF